ncbi:MAG: DUF1987 domain-containing protein [Bacteroidia bacterium]
MNEELIITETEDTPYVELCQSNAVFKISGKSLPEDAFWFYNPIHEWLASYAKNPLQETIFNFNLEYYNTASAKQIFKIINLLSEISAKSKVEIRWHYDEGDKDMMSSGERFSRLCSTPIQLVKN